MTMAATTVHAPVADFHGQVAGFAFVDGKAEVPVDSGQLTYFRRQGYGIGKPAPRRPKNSPAVDSSG